MQDLQLFQTRYEEQITLIKATLESDNAAVRHLVNWLFKNTNPYGVFVEELAAEAMESAPGFAGICRLITDAIVNDGHICFPVVNGRPHIAFVKAGDVAEDYFLTQSDRCNRALLLMKGVEKGYTLEFMETVYGFTELYDKVEAERKSESDKALRIVADIEPQESAPDHFEFFERSHRLSMGVIKRHLQHDNADIRHLVNWLCQVETSSDRLFSEDWACHAMGTAEGFANICIKIGQALEDNGKICFPIVRGWPRISFMSRQEGKIGYYCNDADYFIMRMRRLSGANEEAGPPVFLENVYEFTRAFDAATAAFKKEK